jgi:hypothetical protein
VLNEEKRKKEGRKEVRKEGRWERRKPKRVDENNRPKKKIVSEMKPTAHFGSRVS